MMCPNSVNISFFKTIYASDGSHIDRNDSSGIKPVTLLSLSIAKMYTTSQNRQFIHIQYPQLKHDCYIKKTQIKY